MSATFRLNKEDLIKIAKGLLIATVGAVLTYLTDLIPKIDWGAFTPLVTAGFSVFANMVRKLVNNCK